MPKDQVSQIEKIRHSLSHLMTMAIIEKYPKTGLGIGPWIENGWYQDYDIPVRITEADFEWIEKRMKELIKEGIVFEQELHSYQRAKELAKDDPYKMELIEDLAKEGETEFSFYRSGCFLNLCAGPHVKDTSEINPDAFTLTNVSGAYWKGDEKNKMLTRIYGVGFETKEELKHYLKVLEEAKKRDHRKLGKELDLFVFSQLIGPGLPLYTPKGYLILDQIKLFSRELNERMGYKEVFTPQINRSDLFKISGHYDKFHEDMFLVKSHYTDDEYFLKPMNCPQHTQLYAAKKRSYRDLPFRISDFSLLYRDEKPGELSGLARLRCFSQDDGHAFVRPDQIKAEFESVMSAINEALRIYGLSYWIRLSLWDSNKKENYLGDEFIWEKSQSILKEILDHNNVNYKEAEGEAALYGPKMDFIAQDALGREYQISTIQIDFNMPGRFGLTYIDKNGKKQTPVMIHRALVGSPERFFSILIEHYAGAWPTWLAPVQVQIIPVGSPHQKFADDLAQKFKKIGIRVDVDGTNETVGNKIRKAETQKVPYMLVVGDKEMSSGKLVIRKRGEKNTQEMTVENFSQNIKAEIQKRLS